MTRDRYDRLQASNSFKPDEIETMRALFAAWRRGGDVTPYLKAEPMRRVERKFIRMGNRIETIKQTRTGQTKPTREEVLDRAYTEP